MRSKYFVWLSLVLPLASVVAPAQAQNAAPAANRAASGAAGGFEILNKPRLIVRSNGARLEAAGGLPARVRSSQIDLTAQVIALDYANNTISQMRAKSGVKLLLNLPGQGAGAEAVRLEVQADDTVLDAVARQGRRSLVLTGNVKGFYEVGGVRNTLQGNKVIISFGTQPSRDLRADIEGGSGGVRLEVAGQNFGGETGQLGNIVLTAQRASVDQMQGQARLIGTARAVSSGGANSFDVTASEFLVKFGGGATRSLDSLQTVGRAQIKISMPPQPGTTAKPAPAEDANSLRPTYVEIAADNATVAGASQTLTLNGNVQGFYRIAAPTDTIATSGGTAAAAGSSKGMAGDYRFSGSRAVLRMVAEKEATPENPIGLNLDISSVSMELPGLDLGFGEEANKNVNGRN
ncbi:MAG: hypothetical protein JWN98_852 [Abditibacteriota bacterium]|nr:hypothetical protein [Abditibacteriota bacterium]